MANQWFRMYAEFATDPKVQMLSEPDQRRYMMILCLRCSNGDETLHETMSDCNVAFQLRISGEEWAKTKAVLLSKNLIDECNLPVSWDKRQYKSDNSYERVKAYRERKKTQNDDDVTGDETLQKRNDNGAVTPPDTDTDTDKKNRRGTRLPADWKLPDDWKTEALKIRPDWHDQHVQRIADGFRDYWIAKTGASATKLDWFATWRNWCRNDKTQVYPGPQSANGIKPVNGQPCDSRQDPNWRPKPMPRPSRREAPPEGDQS